MPLLHCRAVSSPFLLFPLSLTGHLLSLTTLLWSPTVTSALFVHSCVLVGMQEGKWPRLGGFGQGSPGS